MPSPTVFNNRGMIVFASEPPGIVLLQDDHNRVYLSTDKDLAVRIQRCTFTDEILASFVAYEVGSSRAAVCVRLDIEEIHDDGDPSRWLNASDSNSSDKSAPPVPSPDDKNTVLLDSAPKDIGSLAASSEDGIHAPVSCRRKLNFSRVEVTEPVGSKMEKWGGDLQKKKWLSATNKVKDTVEIATAWWEDPACIQKVMRSNDIQSIQRQHHLLNMWWFIPSKLNKSDYPFPCSGIVVAIPGTTRIKIISPRVGSFIKQEDPRRFGRPLAYFFCIGKYDYCAFEYSEFPCSMISASPVLPCISDLLMEVVAKGYAIISPSSDPEVTTWQAWNDQCGLMKCLRGCANEMRMKEPDWEPLCHLIRFEAINQGGSWKITKLMEVDVDIPRQINYLPTDLYFVTDVWALRKETQLNGLPVFVSPMLEENTIAAEFEHVHLGDHFDFDGIFSLWALVFATWNNGRQFRAIAIATPDAWRAHGHLRAMADTLKLSGWNEKRKFLPMEAELLPPE